MTGETHEPGYQARDRAVVDYQMYQLPGVGLSFRGPRPDLDAPYFSCLGAAQTFGCFCEQPFPRLLEQELEIPVLNLGYGGAGPEFYSTRPELLALVNRGRFAVIQIMSGRSVSNSLFESGGLEFLTVRADGRRLGANAAYAELLDPGRRWRRLPVVGRPLAVAVRQASRPRIRRIIDETRDHWIESYRQLFARVEVPIVLLWFSVRDPDYQEELTSVRQLFGEFPQLVNRAMVDALVPDVDHYVECTTDRGLPQPLFDRLTGAPTTVDPSADRPDLGGRRWTHNEYYPAPEMHEDALRLLLPACRVAASDPLRGEA